MKTRIIFSVIATDHNGKQHEQFLKANELHLISKILTEAEKVEIRKYKVSQDYFNNLIGQN